MRRIYPKRKGKKAGVEPHKQFKRNRDKAYRKMNGKRAVHAAREKNKLIKGDYRGLPVIAVSSYDDS